MNQGGDFDLPQKEKRIQELEQKVNDENFWQNVEESTSVNQELTALKKERDFFIQTKKSLEEDIELIDIIEEHELENLKKEIDVLEQEIKNLEINCLLSKEFDQLNCYLEIHPGAGGTESCDWASMLARMYTRFCESNHYNYEIIESQKGEEAGLKSFTM